LQTVCHCFNICSKFLCCLGVTRCRDRHHRLVTRFSEMIQFEYTHYTVIITHCLSTECAIAQCTCHCVSVLQFVKLVSPTRFKDRLNFSNSQV